VDERRDGRNPPNATARTTIRTTKARKAMSATMKIVGM
jgi:hypothetical protein